MPIDWETVDNRPPTKAQVEAWWNELETRWQALQDSKAHAHVQALPAGVKAMLLELESVLAHLEPALKMTALAIYVPEHPPE